ncbi:MAG: PepSY-associated TM helix domain-containing protein [Bacteroidales bacterium]|nr:PepSY-associated TM helix domain-containing protein [Bacteroidales bacterium]
MGKALRKFNRATHRDLGYFFVGMIIIYSLSGIAINHLDDWNPNYVLNSWTKKVEQVYTESNFDSQTAKDLLKEWKINDRYRKFYWNTDGDIKIFFKNGTALIDVETKNVFIETLGRRPVFHAVNWLHYNPNAYWTWFSDIFAGALIILSITGMFILRGPTGLKWRGTILIGAGLLIPAIYLIIFYF